MAVKAKEKYEKALIKLNDCGFVLHYYRILTLSLAQPPSALSFVTIMNIFVCGEQCNPLLKKQWIDFSFNSFAELKVMMQKNNRNTVFSTKPKKKKTHTHTIQQNGNNLAIKRSGGWLS